MEMLASFGVTDVVFLYIQQMLFSCLMTKELKSGLAVNCFRSQNTCLELKNILPLPLFLRKTRTMDIFGIPSSRNDTIALKSYQQLVLKVFYFCTNFNCLRSNFQAAILYTL